MDAPVTWVAFQDENDFRAWHDLVCADHGIPAPPTNQATGDVDTAAQWTTAYVNPWIDHAAPDLIKADVPDDDVDRYGLRPTDPPSWSPDSLYQPPEPPPWDWHQPVPDLKES